MVSELLLAVTECSDSCSEILLLADAFPSVADEINLVDSVWIRLNCNC